MKARELKCISQPQIELFQILSKIFPDAELEYSIGGRVKKVGHRKRWADIGIPSLKIDFEYDGWGHKDTPWADSHRDKELLEQGWETIRINSDRLSEMKWYGEQLYSLSQSQFLEAIRKRIREVGEVGNRFNQ